MDFTKVILREEVSYRGGGVEIALDSFGYKGEKMTAYQNYLGGGLLGRVVNDCTIPNWRDDEKLVEIGMELRKYFFDKTNPDSEWEHQSFEQNQKMPISAY